ncbi:MAG: phosphate/phosphite/phosphonate ABC transporter substrate-binding protein [Burkholderiaceae bacterium]|nr:phosphate/phosphite/phosphonate ABC transporter substrate-binding protein [Aquabacterium sp.]NUP84493.1 phosphate/phosphite/phosphonate ABC transporter substrate-binding protein [Burkholderiaceae bacterium]
MATSTARRCGLTRLLALAVTAATAAVMNLGLVAVGPAHAADDVLRFGVGLYQPDKEKNDATYRPLADHLSRHLGRPVKLYTVDTWEGLAKSLANGETDIALMGPWGYVLANHVAGAQAVATILYDGKPEYFAIMVTHPNSGIRSIADLKGRSFAFGDKGSTSGYLVPYHHFQKNGIDPDKYLGRVLNTKHQAIELQVTRGEIDAGADYNRNRDAMIAEGLIRAADSVIFWTSDPLPNDAVAVRADLAMDAAFVARLRTALEAVGPELRRTPDLLPARYTGFVAKDNAYYRPIRDAGLATGKLASQ